MSAARLLANKAYAGIVAWNDVEYPGLHQPLTDPDTFQRVQDLLDGRSARGRRERKHHRYLKGTLYCGNCGRRLSVQQVKGRYLYFYCLGQRGRHRYRTNCKEPFTPAGDLETGLETLYRRVQLPDTWLEPLHQALDTELAARTGHSTAERTAIEQRLAKTDTERRILLDAFSAGAIDAALLKQEQEPIGRDAHAAQERLDTLNATAGELRNVISAAMRLAANCADTYTEASEQIRKRLNRALIRRVEVKDKRIAKPSSRRPSTCSSTHPGLNTTVWWR